MHGEVGSNYILRYISVGYKIIRKQRNKTLQVSSLLLNARTSYSSTYMQLILFIKSTRKSIQVRFLSSLVSVSICDWKQLQWMCPTEFKDIVWMLGPLHIEQVFIKAIGDWIENSGQAELYGYLNINSNGRVHSFSICSGDAGIKGSRYAHQLTLAY